MKILPDKNIDVSLKEELSWFDTKTVIENDWTGLKNGKLLELSVLNNYDVFLNLDPYLKHQQSLSKFNLHILVIKSKDSGLKHLKHFIPKNQFLINNLSAKTKYEIEEVKL